MKERRIERINLLEKLEPKEDTVNSENMGSKLKEEKKIKIPKEDLEEIRKRYGDSFISLYCFLWEKRIISSTEEFKKLYEKWEEKAGEMFKKSKKENLKWALGFYDVKTSEEFEKFCEKSKVIDMIRRAKPENLKWALMFCGIKTPEKFEEFCNRSGIINILESFTLTELEKIEKEGFKSRYIREEVAPLMEFTPDFQRIYENFEKNLKKTKGNYFIKTFPKKDLSHISLSFLYSYLALKNKNENALKKLEERVGECKEEEKKRVEKISKNIQHKVLDISSFLLGKRATESLFEKENVDYLSVAREMKIPFDYYKILGSNLNEIKEKVDERAKEIIEDYSVSEKKERYLPHLSSLLAYGEQYKEEVNEILKIEDLWKFKFSHIEKNLMSLLDKIKDLKIEIREKIKKEPVDINTFIENLDKHLKIEGFEKAGERIPDIIKEKNRKLAKELIEKIKQVIDCFKKGEIPNEKDTSFILSYKEILKHLGLSLTYNSLILLCKKLTIREKKKILVDSVEIIKRPEECFSAMNIELSCMRAKGERPHDALTVIQAPILIIGVKDIFGKIVGRALLIPIKEKGEWRFELKKTYGIGGEYIKDFIKEVEEKIGKGKIEEKLIKGEIPKSKKLKSTRVETLNFFRDGMDSTKLKVQTDDTVFGQIIQLIKKEFGW